MKSNLHTSESITLFLVGSLLILPALAGVAAAADSNDQAQDKAQFQKLLSERRKLSTKLYQLDQKAADKIRGGEDPVIIHADQIGLQDQLDLIELRAEILAIRLGETLPDIGGGNAGYESTSTNEKDPVETRARDVLQRGRSRAMNRLRRDCLQLLASIDFSRFIREIDQQQ